MNTRSTASVSVTALLSAAAAAILTPACAQAQVHLSGPTGVFGNSGGLTFYPGSNSSSSASLGASTFTGTFVGDVVTSLQGSNSSGTYNGSTQQYTIIPFNVSGLPVQIGNASLHGNFKILASGGNGIAGGNDPVVAAVIEGRVYQQVNSIINPSADPRIPGTNFAQTYTQNGNGLQILDADIGAGAVNYILTPGAYYLYEIATITTHYTSDGSVQPVRGMTMEFGGGLSSGYSGLEYTFGWQTVPTPGAGFLVGLAGLAASRRRRS